MATGVVEEVAHHLTQRGRVTKDPHRGDAGGVDVRGCLIAGLAGGLPDEVVEVDGPARQSLWAAGVQAG